MDCEENFLLKEFLEWERNEFTDLSLVFNKMQVHRAVDDNLVLEVSLDQFRETDVDLLVKVLTVAKTSPLQAIDVNYCHHANSLLTGDAVLKVLDAAGLKLRKVDLQHSCFGSHQLRRCLCNAILDFRDLFQDGLQCQSLDLTYAYNHKLDIRGPFMFLHTLKLDFSYSITSFSDGCFSSMPNLIRLSLCGTSISNLWTTTAALVSLKMLSELRFQKCPCCSGTRYCSSRSKFRDEPVHPQVNSRQQGQGSDVFELTTLKEDDFNFQDDTLSNASSEDSCLLFPDDDLVIPSATSHLISDDYLGGEYLMSSYFEGYQQQQSGAVDDSKAEPHGDASKSRRVLEADPNQPDGATDNKSSSASNNGSLSSSLPSIQAEEIFDNPKTSQQSGIHCPGGSDPSEPDADIFSLIRRVKQKVSIDQNIERIQRASPSKNSLGNADSEELICSKEARSELISRGSASTSDYPSRVAPFCHSSPICFEKHYKHYIVAGLPNLKVLDNCEISQKEKELAQRIYADNFELLPYNRKKKENIVKAVERREIGGLSSAHQGYKKMLGPMINDCSSAGLCRSMSAAMQASCTWPAMSSLCKFFKPNDRSRKFNFRPRQFEYHPTDASLMVIGTLHGEVVVVNHEADKLVGYADPFGAPHSILGLCWFNKDPNKLIAGSDNGSVRLFDLFQMRARVSVADESIRCVNRGCGSSSVCSFEDFEELTSVHINSTDDLFIASGYSKDVCLYNLHTGKKINILPNLHRKHINVVKFSNHSPNLFATSSFDKDIKLWDLREKVTQPIYTVSSTSGNVMVCFSYDDQFLLASAVDNEVHQHLAVDGKLHMKYDIAPTGSGKNFTRSYYMNGRDYIITGSCEENVVRIYCAQTGRRLKDLALEGCYNDSPYVQSLRGDLFQDFQFSVLVAYNHPKSKSDIVKVNLMSCDQEKYSHESTFGSLPNQGA